MYMECIVLAANKTAKRRKGIFPSYVTSTDLAKKVNVSHMIIYTVNHINMA